MLHNNKELFEQAVLKTAEYMHIDAGIVEKDYYVTLLLKEISTTVPDLVFKGGTSLSKCYKIINCAISFCIYAERIEESFADRNNDKN